MKPNLVSRSLRSRLLLAFLTLACAPWLKLAAQPTTENGVVEPFVNNSKQARERLVDDLKKGTAGKSATELAVSIGRPGKDNALGLTTDKEVARATTDIAHRLKAARSRKEAREFYKEALKANDRIIKSLRKSPDDPERIQLLIQNTRIVGLELGDLKKAQKMMEEITSLAPDDDRGRALYDKLSYRHPETFPPVRRYPAAR